MNYLFELSRSLRTEEQKLFKKYLTHKSSNRDRKDLDVFSLICESQDDDIQQHILKIYGKYSDANLKAYNMIKVRIKKNLEDFIALQIRKDDNIIYVNKLISIATFLLSRKKYSIAWRYLAEAEQIAIQIEEYEILNQIYKYMLEYVWTKPQQNLDLLVIKYQNNLSNAYETAKITMAISIISNKISSADTVGEILDIDTVCTDILNHLGVDKNKYITATFKYKLATLLKITLESKKDYFSSYNYTINIYNEMEQDKMFNEHNQHYKINLLNTICYSSARAGEYSITEKYFEIILSECKNYPDLETLVIPSFMAKVVLLGMDKKLKEALEFLEYLRNKHKNLYLEDDYLFCVTNENSVCLNIGLGNLHNAKRNINELLRNSKRVLRINGLAGLINIYITECMIAIDMQDYEFAEYRLISLTRKFKSTLLAIDYQRHSEFIILLKKIINNPKITKSDYFIADSYHFIKQDLIYKPGNEFVSFNAWLYSKITNTNFDEASYNEVIKHLK